jgi:hypothetical protein
MQLLADSSSETLAPSVGLVLWTLVSLAVIVALTILIVRYLRRS